MPAANFQGMNIANITLPAEARMSGAPAMPAEAAPQASSEVGAPKLDVDKQAPVRETRGWSADSAPEDAPHLPMIAQGHAAVPPELEQLAHPGYSPFEQQTLDWIQGTRAGVTERLRTANSASSAADLGEQAARLDQSRDNLVAGYDERRQRTAATNRPAAIEQMAQLREQLLGPPSAEADAAAANVPITDAARGSFGQRGEAGVRTDLADFARLTGSLPDVQLDRTDPRASYRFGGPGQQSTLNVGAKASSKTITHELAHGLEHDHPELAEAARSFLDARAAFASPDGAPTPQRLDVLDPANRGEYRPDELALEGGFASKYTGKLYPDATEVITTGLDTFVDPERMLELFQRDPEHFELILGMLRTLKAPR